MPSYSDWRAHFQIATANQGRAKSLNAIINSKSEYISYGIKFSDSNIGYENKILTFPWFLAFLLKRFLDKENFMGD